MITLFFYKRERWKDQINSWKVGDFQQKTETMKGIISIETWISKIKLMDILEMKNTMS